jgi:chemotaxis protein MotB
MARKKKHPEHVNHERWLISYADFITLLFAFFVVMFAVSQVDSKKVGRFTESFSKAVGIEMFPNPGRGLMSGAETGLLGSEAPPSNTNILPEDLFRLKRALKDATEEGLVQVLQRKNELVLRLSDGFLFESGNDSLEERARKVIAKLASELRDRPLYIRVEGHTDNRPIRNARFRSNWDLSTARATAVVARLASEGIAPERLSAAGYGEFHPVATNDTDEGRKQNRRVDLIVSLPIDFTEKPVPPERDEEADGGAPTGQAAPSESPHGSASPHAAPPPVNGHSPTPTHDTHAAPAHDTHAAPTHDTHAAPSHAPSGH